VFKETPAEKLTKADRYAKQLLKTVAE